jgi:outer membrane protein assembly factor BamB
MSTIPTSAFADEVQALSHDQFQQFVAELWSLAGWETSLDGDIVVATKDNRTQRLLVAPAGFLARVRWQPPDPAEFDRVVTAHRRDGESRPRGVPDGPLIDANDLRHRLVYGCDSDDAQSLCREFLDVSFRGSDWGTAPRRVNPVQVGQAVVALGLVVSALGILTLGIPFIQAETAPEPAPASSTLDGGVAVDVSFPPPQQRTAQPTGIAVGETVYATTEAGTLYALDEATGERIWTQNVGNETSAPLVVNGQVYLGTDRGIRALDALTGEIQWTYRDIETVPPRPTVVNGTVYTVDRQRLIALDSQDGDFDWQSFFGPLHSAVTVYDGTVYAQGPQDMLYTVDADTGDNMWEVGESAASFEPTTPIIPETRTPGGAQIVTAAIGDVLSAYNLETGDRQWSYQSRISGPITTPVVVNGTNSLAVEGAVARNATTNTTAYLADTRAYVYAIDTRTGEERWTYDEPGARFEYPIVGEPVGNETAHSVYLSAQSPIESYESAVLALNASTGTQRWAYTSQNKTFGMPTVTEETLYVGTDQGDLVALGTDNRTERWRTAFENSRIEGSPTVVENPTSGDSVDTRVRLGTHGHHGWLANSETAPTQPGLSVLNTTVTERVAAGERLTVRVTLANRNGSRQTETVRVTPEWTAAESVEVTLTPDETIVQEFTITASDEPGSYTTDVQVANETVSKTTRVTERPTFEVTALNDPGQFWTDGQAEIIVSIRNTGEIEATTPIVFEFGGERIETRQRTIGANKTISETFTVTPGDRPPGNYTYAIGTADDGDSTVLELRELNRRADALPIVTVVFGLTLLLTGLGLGWRVLESPIRRRIEQRRSPRSE